MKNFKALIILLILTSCSLDSTIDAQEPRQIVGFFTSWSVEESDYQVFDIPADQITHIIYAFANIANGQIALGDPEIDVEQYYPGDSRHPDSLRGCFHQFQLLKAEHQHIKTLISVGGETWSAHFSDVALTRESRRTFAASCVNFVDRYGFDGVDIDWEFPVEGGNQNVRHREEDRENYTLLIAELRSHLNALGNRNNRPYLLTASTSATLFYVENLELDRLHRYLNWFNVMTYNFHGPWQGDADILTNFNSPLHMARNDPLDEPFHSSFNIEAAVNNYLDQGVPRQKIVVGLPFYGRGYGWVENQNNGLFVRYRGEAPCGTHVNGLFYYWDLKENYINRNTFVAYRHGEARVPWLHSQNASIMISYDDSASIAEKGQFVVEHNLGGVMFWEFSTDYEGELLNSAYYAVEPDNVPIDIFSPVGFSLSQAYPNPFNLATNLVYCLPYPAYVSLRIYDLSGRLVRTLNEGERQTGSYTVCWDGCGAPSGLYLMEFISMQNGRSHIFRAIREVHLLK